MKHIVLPTSENKNNNTNYPVVEKYLDLALIMGGISIFFIMLTMFFIESSWELRMDILMGMIMVALPLICFPIFNKMYEHKEAIKQRLKEEKNKKLLEAQQYLNQLSGNIKTLLIESLQEE
jgi:hypothetical protein